eukprot:6181306-Pleurochrysis_carterae.AAC.2
MPLVGSEEEVWRDEELLGMPSPPVPHVVLRLRRPVLATLTDSQQQQSEPPIDKEQLAQIRKELNKSRLEASALRKELSALKASTRQLIRSMQAAGHGALAAARETVESLSHDLKELKYERSARNRLAARVAELEQEVAVARQAAFEGKRAEAEEKKKAEALAKSLKAEQKKCEDAVDAYRKRARVSATNSSLLQKSIKRTASEKDGLSKECDALREKLKLCQDELEAAEARAESAVSARSQAERQHEAEVEALRAAAEEKANFIPPKAVDRKRLVTLSKARQSQVRQKDLMYLYRLFMSREWSMADVADALLGADMLLAIFKSSAVR